MGWSHSNANLWTQNVIGVEIKQKNFQQQKFLFEAREKNSISSPGEVKVDLNVKLRGI